MLQDEINQKEKGCLQVAARSASRTFCSAKPAGGLRHMHGGNRELAFGLICMMLKEAEEEEFASDLVSVCLRDAHAMKIFMEGFNETFEDYLHDESELCDSKCEDADDEDADNDEPECGNLEDPVFEVHIKVSKNYAQVIQKQVKDSFASLGVPIPDFESGAWDNE